MVDVAFSNSDVEIGENLYTKLANVLIESENELLAKSDNHFFALDYAITKLLTNHYLYIQQNLGLSREELSDFIKESNSYASAITNDLAYNPPPRLTLVH